MFNIILIVLCLLFFQVTGQDYYNWNSASYRNETWMSTLDDGVPIRQITIPGSHSSLATGNGGWAFITQGSSLQVQMKSGIRALDIRCRHYRNTFTIHERSVYLDQTLSGVLNKVKTFLQQNPTETILMHIVEQYDSSGNSRSFADTFAEYKANFSTLIWNVNTQNPSLGMVRGKVVIIQQFGGIIQGLIYGSFTNIPHKKYGTNWDQHDRWINIKNFITAADAAKTSRISFWSGSGGSFPYFCASGKSSPGNGDPRLLTGLTTPGWKKSYPDFPRVMCLWSLCSIAFEGINTLANKWIQNNNYNYLGIVFLDFVGNKMIENFIQRNSNLFGKCNLIQNSRGCTACSPLGQCLSCNQQKNYVYNSISKNCDAASGYYLDSSFQTSLCSDAMIGCLQCSSQTQCSLCDVFLNYALVGGDCKAADGFYLNNLSLPVKCNIHGCFKCSDEVTCTECSSSFNFVMDLPTTDCVCDAVNNFTLYGDVCGCVGGLFLSNSGVCQEIPICPQSNSGCNLCANETDLFDPNITIFKCEQCDTLSNFYLSSPYCLCESGFYFDGANCQACNSSHPPCTTCISSNICTQCTLNFTLSQGRCECMPQFYLFDSDTCLECTVGCLSCSNESSCILCDTANDFVLVNGYCQCKKGKFVDVALYGEICVVCGTMPGCVDCSMFGCIACDDILGFFIEDMQCACNYGYFISPVAVCAQCSMQGCLHCDSEFTCLVCENSTYYLQNETQTCLQTCGDGYLFNLQCDDGNNVDGDGCSSKCKVEKDFTCSGGSIETPSSCSYSGSVSFQLSSFVKELNRNRVIVKAKLLPAIDVFKNIDYQSSIVPSFPISARHTLYDSATGDITFIFDYDKSLNVEREMSVSFTPPDETTFFYTPSAKFSLRSTTDNNLALKVYPDEVYNMRSIITYLVYGLLGLTAIGFVFGMLISSKLIAVEMLLVVQIAYMGLVSIDKLESLMYPFLNLWPVNGYNQMDMFNKQGTNMPPRVAVVGYKDYFLANFNIDIVLMLLPFIAALVCFIIWKIKTDKVWKIRAFVLAKQWAFSILLALQLHLCVSVVFAIKFGLDQMYGLAVGAVLCLSLVIFCIVLVVKPKNFGDYKTFFFSTGFKSNFYIIVVLSRLIISGIIPAFNDSNIGLITSIAVLSIFIISLIIFRPYKSIIRPIANSLVSIAVLSVYLAYSMNIIAETTWMTTYLPLILIVLLICCIVANIMVMIQHRFCNSLEMEMAKRDEYFDAMEESFENETKKQINLEGNGITYRVMQSQVKQKMLTQQSAENPSLNLLKQIRKELSISKQGLESDQEYIMKEYEAI